MEPIIIVLFWAAIWAIIAKWIAGEKGRDEVAWSVWGAIFGVFAVIILAIVPAKELK